RRGGAVRVRGPYRPDGRDGVRVRGRPRPRARAHRARDGPADGGGGAPRGALFLAPLSPARGTRGQGTGSAALDDRRGADGRGAPLPAPLPAQRRRRRAPSRVAGGLCGPPVPGGRAGTRPAAEAAGTVAVL